MRWLLVALLLAAPVAASEAGNVTLRFTATDDGFLVEGLQGLNPRVVIEPGSSVEAILSNAASEPHNLRFGAPVDEASPCCTRPGGLARVSFAVDADAHAESSYSSDGAPRVLRGSVSIRELLPEVRIASPARGTDVRGDVELVVEVSNFDLEAYPGFPTNEPRKGHVTYALDGKHAFGPTDRTTHTFSGLTRGTHLLSAELVNRDGTPLSPRAYAEVVVHRLGDAAEPAPQPSPPPPSKTPVPVLLAIVGLVIASRFRRPPR